MKTSTYIKCAAIGLALSSAAPAATLDNAHLHQINHTIHRVQQHLMRDQQQQQRQQHALESLETNSAQAALELHKVNQNIKTTLNGINTLQKKLSQYENTIAQQRKNLANNIRTLYMLGTPSDLQLLLEQDDPSKIARTFTYYKYLNKQRSDQIDSLQSSLNQVQTTLQVLQQNYRKLSQLKRSKQHQLDLMEHLKIKRNNLIFNIKNNIQSESQKLHELLFDKQQLETELRNLYSKSLFFQAIGKPFSQLKHHLSWPTKGKLVAKYGTKFDKSQLIWEGVLFKTHMDQPVYAVADGKVIFSRWLQGYGLLIIIYHGQGYMTLYGRNHYLYKKTGDLVRAGDQIAAVGDTGGHQSAALYFAIRHNTLPMNPLAWFKRA